MENHEDIKALGKYIEQQVGILLAEIENMKKTIISNARQDAMIEVHNAKQLSEEIVESAIRQSQKYLTKFKHNDGSSSNLEKYDPDLEFW